MQRLLTARLQHTLGRHTALQVCRSVLGHERAYRRRNERRTRQLLEVPLQCGDFDGQAIALGVEGEAEEDVVAHGGIEDPRDLQCSDKGKRDTVLLYSDLFRFILQVQNVDKAHRL